MLGGQGVTRVGHGSGRWPGSSSAPVRRRTFRDSDKHERTGALRSAWTDLDGDSFSEAEELARSHGIASGLAETGLASSRSSDPS